mgnify:CR=1 FL=1
MVSHGPSEGGRNLSVEIIFTISTYFLRLRSRLNSKSDTSSSLFRTLKSSVSRSFPFTECMSCKYNTIFSLNEFALLFYQNFAAIITRYEMKEMKFFKTLYNCAEKLIKYNTEAFRSRNQFAEPML